MKSQLTAFALCASSCLFAVSAHAQTVTPVADAEQRILDYLATAEAVNSSGALLVTIGDETLISTGYGWAVRSTEYPATPESVFDMGSLTKQFTAVAILVLQERGELRLDQTLGDYFPDVPADRADVTLHQLLTHTSGLSDHTGGFEGSDRDPYISREDFIATLFASPLSRPHGTSLEYSNAGYTLLAAIIEDVTGQDYETFLTEAVLHPAGMDQTGYRQPDWPEANIANSYFHGFLDPERADIGNFIDRWREEDVSWRLLGNGGLHSTLIDMGKWHRALQDGTILTPASTRLMHYPHASWGEDDPDHYGYGWVVETASPGTPVNHAGSNGVFNATIRRYPADDIMIMHWTNESRPAADRMGSVVRRILLDADYQPRPVHASPYALVDVFTQTHPPSSAADLNIHIETETGRPLSDRRILNRIGFHLLREDRSACAIALFRENISLFPGDGNLHDSLGEAYFMLGQYEDAKPAFETALSLAPEDGSCGWCTNARERLAEIEAR